MKLCNITLSIIIIVICSVLGIVLFKEHFTETPQGTTPSTFNYDPNEATCWAHVKRHYGWNPDSFTNEQKKVLMTMRRLSDRAYEDNSSYFPAIVRYCVIPSAHLPIFNKQMTDTMPWDLYNPTNPDPNSKGYMTYTEDNETPSGYKLDLTKHDQQSFQAFLDQAYKLYDQEFLAAKATVEANIAREQGINTQRINTLANLRGEIASLDNQIAALLGCTTQCQMNKREYLKLQSYYSYLVNELNCLNSLNSTSRCPQTGPLNTSDNGSC